MNLLLFFLNYLLGRLPGGWVRALAAGPRSARQILAWQPHFSRLPARSATYGWMYRASEHPLCARPPCGAPYRWKLRATAPVGDPRGGPRGKLIHRV